MERRLRRRAQMVEPTSAERRRYHAWLDRHRGQLAAAWYAAEALARAYDRAALITSADGRPELPAELQAEIADLRTRWEAARWASQKRHPA